MYLYNPTSHCSNLITQNTFYQQHVNVMTYFVYCYTYTVKLEI